MAGFVVVIENFVARKIVQSNPTIFSTLTMKDNERKVIGTKVATKVTNVRSVQWCKSRYGFEFKANKS
jgi:hypothetical protein